MADFLAKVKLAFVHERNRGMREEIFVDRRAIHELVDAFEKMDSHFRLVHNAEDLVKHEQYRLLDLAIKAIYHMDGKSSEMLLFRVTDTLKKLREERAYEAESKSRIRPGPYDKSPFRTDQG